MYRTNAQSRAFEEAFIRRHLPYRIVGGTKFYERKEIKDLLAYLRLGFNDQDSPSLIRTIKLGKRRFQKFQSWLNQVEQSTLDNPLAALQGILEVTDYRSKFKPKNPDDQARLDNIDELLNVASQFEHSLNFLENVALIQDGYLLDQKMQVNNTEIRLMSLHSAKGLEFDIVFMVGMEEGLLPHSRSMMKKDDLEEERRLCYVGITRAKKELFLTCARQRYSYGHSGQSAPSRFLSEIDHSLLQVNRQYDQAPSWQNHRFKTSHQQKIHTKANKNKRRLVIDEDQLDALLNDELDIKDFLKS